MSLPQSSPVLCALALLAAACGTPSSSAPGTTSSTAPATTISTAATTSGSSTAPACGTADAAPCGPDTYEALSLFTNVPRAALLKASPSRSLCFRLVLVEGSGTGLPGFTGNATVESGLVTHDPADCEVSAPPLPTPAGPTAPVVSGHGTVSIDTTLPCSVTLAATAVFSGAPSWAPPSEPLDANALAIMGGCP
jgi:hypothetical protein